MQTSVYQIITHTVSYSNIFVKDIEYFRSKYIFIDCKSSHYGGALELTIGTAAESTLKNLSFNRCDALQAGGAIYVSLSDGGKLTISELCSFADCKTYSDSSLYSGSGGAIQAYIGLNSQLILEDTITFDRCTNGSGGGMCIRLAEYGSVRQTGSCFFTECKSQNGGGLDIETSRPNYDIQLLGNMQFEGCESDYEGGGFKLYCNKAGSVTINGMLFHNCNTTGAGGGFSYNGYDGAQMTITDKVTFNNCNSQYNGGGGMYMTVRDSESMINITG
ncbi:MAG: hypothetical protein EZS28_017163 [Streblomastix strix]|uniref:Right handed beta helix domain-containing protein n=1 Tax=Streblomastix strix TaxID=222440 RepID=A0A5J4VXQ7_9EUKA|nr:MAG: hypothetical protein EZS28_017163 [Streblomastix strix]